MNSVRIGSHYTPYTAELDYYSVVCTAFPIISITHSVHIGHWLPLQLLSYNVQ